MTLYETIVACVAITNLVFTLAVFQANRGKAAATKLQELSDELRQAIAQQGDQLRSKVSEHDVLLAQLQGGAEKAPSHKDLADIYQQVNAARSQIDSLAGSVAQMNANLNLVLNRFVNGGIHGPHA